MKKDEISPKIVDLAPEILETVEKAKSILLCLHPSPDPDSVGSALAMKFALEGLNKKATVIAGDSVFPSGFEHFPGAGDIVRTNFFEIDLNNFDLFISVDAASLEMISRRGKIEFPKSLNVIVIDHHASNIGYGNINLIETSYPATCQILADLFGRWKIELSPEIATNLFMGMYTDTGGFKYKGTTAHTFEVVAHLTEFSPDFHRTISKMEYSETPGKMTFMGLGLSSIKTYFNGRIAIAAISHEMLKSKNLNESDIGVSDISRYMNYVSDWDVSTSAVEVEPNVTKFSFRCHDPEKFNVSKLVVPLGGGGHPAAAGLSLNLPIDQAIKLVVEKAKELYNL